jgi:hypothetical protein
MSKHADRKPKTIKTPGPDYPITIGIRVPKVRRARDGQSALDQ